MSTAAPSGRTLLIGCRNNDGVAERVRRRFESDASAAWFEVDCAGTLHPGTVSYLAGHFDGTVILGCPPQNCVYRYGARLADARILEDQRPAIPGRIARQSVRVLHHAMGEWPQIVSAIDQFRRSPSEPPSSVLGAGRVLLAVTFSVGLLVLVAVGTRWPQGADADYALLRLGWRLAGQVRERCRELPAEELAKRPVHMRQPRECTTEVLSYNLTAAVDDRVVLQKKVRPSGFRADRPLSVEEDLRIAPGEHVVRVTFTPEDAGSNGKVLALVRRTRFDRQRVVLVTYDSEALVIR
jgi:coenzyme F420-reducing hydrogenase delta subunit